jgi:hypothetical protein
LLFSDFALTFPVTTSFKGTISPDYICLKMVSMDRTYRTYEARLFNIILGICPGPSKF